MYHFLYTVLLANIIFSYIDQYGVFAYQKVLRGDKLVNESSFVSHWGNQRSRNGRYLFPFAVVNFPPEPCSPTNTQQMDGVCLSKTRCMASGGETVGACQQGLGTCCKFTKQCYSSRRSVTVVETVENLMSSNMAGSCEFLFPKQQGICQVRLDFVNVMLQEAQIWGQNAGNCQSESLTVIGAANLNGPLKVCGRLSGQHMILSYGATSDLISVIVHSEMISAIYSIRATQIPCNSPYKAPDDCLQYFYGTTGVLKSFGFPRQLNNQRYTVCVKPSSGGSTLSWDRCTDADADGTVIYDRFKVSEHSTPCLTDWIAIDAEKRCGQYFLPMMTSLAFSNLAIGSHARIRVNFDENETGNDVFTVTLPPITTDPDQKVACETRTRVVDPTFLNTGPTMRLCNYTTMGNLNVCRCKFSNFPDNTAQAFKIEVPNNLQNYLCPKIMGYTASPERLGDGVPLNECKYYANIRISDSNNTGFCLRYQAM